MPNKNDQLLQELAVQLSKNHVNVSLIKLGEKEPEKIFDEIFAYDTRVVKGERFIVVVGAGASNDACPRIPMGGDAAKTLLKKYKTTFGKVGHDLIRDELKRLEKVARLNRDDFETVLLAISKFFPGPLRKDLKLLYNHRYFPSQTYEIIAHLLKHRFVDAVINFNFDELLDQAIRDELTPHDYISVFSDGDYNEQNIMGEAGLLYPMYIKPHGTVSHPSTLRFTREDYYALPYGIETLIDSLLGGATDINHKTPEIKINLIVVGFAMQSLEFNALLEKNARHLSKIYWLTPRTPLYDGKYPDLQKGKKHSINAHALLKHLFESGDGHIAIRKASDKHAPDPDKHGLDETFSLLWEKIAGEFHPAYRPRGLSRHCIITQLFKNHQLLPEGERPLQYLKDRVWIELLISIAKYKGFLTLHQLSNDRFGRYFELYIKELEIWEHGGHSVSADWPRTIAAFCRHLLLQVHGFAGGAFYLPPQLPQGEEDPDALTIRFADFRDNHWQALRGQLAHCLHPDTYERLDKAEPELIQHLERLFSEEDTEVSTPYEQRFSTQFAHPVFIKTNLHLHYITIALLRQQPWDSMFCVAETGEWALNSLDQLQEKDIRLIIADDALLNRHQKKNNRKKRLTVHKLPWWLHNQHMTILAAGEPDNYRPLVAIYFVRQHRDARIHPVLLRDDQDLLVLLETFAAYTIRAETFQKAKGKAVAMLEPDLIKAYLRQHFRDWFRPFDR